jgi:hypothetical protein
MSDGWLDPGKYERLQITSCTGPGTQYDGYSWKFVLHSTESPPGSINGINSLFRSQPCSCPHFTIDPGNNRRVQYIPWTWSACALRGGRNGYQTNRGRAVQMEVCGYAQDSPNWSDETLWLIADVIADVIKDGCPINANTVNDMTRLSGVLATESAPQRMAPQTFKTYDGITFHVEAPFNDHWDQGKIRSLDIARMVREILAGSGVPIPPPSGAGGGGGETVDVGYMKMGMAGGIVQFLQQLLIGLGYSCGPAGADSDFGPGTDTAVRAFQRDNSLVVDGIWGPASAQKISEKYAPIDGKPTPPPPPAAGSNAPTWPGRFLLLCDPMMNGEDIRTWQQQMFDRGWRIGVDGWFGLECLGIAKTYQNEKGLIVDGVIGRQSWDAAWTAPIQ